MKKIFILILLLVGSYTIQVDAQVSVIRKTATYVGKLFGKETAKEGAKETAKEGAKEGVKTAGKKGAAKAAGKAAIKDAKALRKITVKKCVSSQMARKALREGALSEIKNADVKSFYALSKKFTNERITKIKPPKIFEKGGTAKYEKTYESYLKKGAKRKPALNKEAKATASAERALPKTQKELEQFRPSGNGGINAEGRTNLEIVKKPITDACSKNALAELKTASKSSKDRLAKDFFSEHKVNTVPKPSVNGEVDLSCAKVGNFTSKCPEIKDYPKLIGKNAKDITQEDIRKYNYSKIINEFAKEYNIKPSEARNFIGKCDLAIHEDAKGVMYFVPNNIHRNQQLYKHNGYVSKSIKVLTGRNEVEIP